MGYEEIQKRAAEMNLPVYQYQRVAAQRALKLTAELNFQYHEPEEVNRLFSELIGKPVVTKDVPSMTVVGGVPAKIIKTIPSGEEAKE